MGVKVKGGAEILAKLARIQSAISDEKQAQAALDEALVPVKEAMERGLEPHRRSGKTIEDVQIRPLESPAAGVVRAAVGLSGSKRGRSFIGRFLEFGALKVRNGKVVGQQAASPWARPALDQEGGSKFLNRLGEAWRRRVMKG